MKVLDLNPCYFSVEFACSRHVCVGFLKVLRLPTSQRHADVVPAIHWGPVQGSAQALLDSRRISGIDNGWKDGLSTIIYIIPEKHADKARLCQG